MFRARAIRVWLVSWLVVSSVEALLRECPEPEDIYPCYCEEESNKQEVYCNHIEDPNQIYGAAKRLKGYTIDLLSFNKIRMNESIRSDAFMGTSVKDITFYNSVVSLDSPQFAGMEGHLARIKLMRCFNSDNPLVTLSLGHLVKLEDLTMSGNEIEELPDGWLSSAPDSLTALYLYDNGFTRLGDHAFADIKSASSIVLNGNKFTSLKRSMLPKPAKNLLSLSFSGSQLNHLPPDMFVEMPNLGFVDLRNNLMTTLEKSTWFDVWPQLLRLRLEDNPLLCDSSMRWLLTSSKKPSTLAGSCVDPENLRGKSIDKLEAQDFD